MKIEQMNYTFPPTMIILNEREFSGKFIFLKRFSLSINGDRGT